METSHYQLILAKMLMFSSLTIWTTTQLTCKTYRWNLHNIPTGTGKKNHYRYEYSLNVKVVFKIYTCMALEYPFERPSLA